MGKLNPIEKAKYINNRYKEYLRSSFQFGDGSLQKLFYDQLEKEVLYKGPYIDMNLPFKRGANIEQLIQQGVICKSFANLGDINLTRPLYYHQEEAMHQIGKGRSAVITTGTGSGKTESFLYPILNDILKEIETGNNDVGIRALFLYPMNALVNDQIDRVRKILSNYPEITYGFFTGETEENLTAAKKKSIELESGVVIPDNELLSRKEIRKAPPHLLFTNYSMLEYLLLRPGDFSIFSNKHLKNWNYVVLDEAHSYYGSKGIEISLLMRRLTALSENKPRFILTSATLGEKGESEDDIVEFARKLTSVSFEKEDVIFSTRIPLDKKLISYRVDPADYKKIKMYLKDNQKLKEIVQKYYENVSELEKENLYELLIRDQTVFEIYTLLKDQSKDFNKIKGKLDIRTTELIDLIDLINYAEKDGMGIFDLKYHSFVKPLTGAFITATENPELSLNKTNYLHDMRAFELGNCKYCYTPYIIGRIYESKKSGLRYLYQNSEIDIYENYGDNEHSKIDYFLFKNYMNDDVEEIENLEECQLCAKCGSIYATDNLVANTCSCGDEYASTVYRVVQTIKNGEEFTLYNNIHQCPCCAHSSNKSGVVRTLNLGSDEGTALIAQFLLESLEEPESKQKQIKKISLRDIKNNTLSNKVNEKNIKQFLSFSDSRQQASFASVFFNDNHRRLLQKRIIWDVIEKNKYKDLSVDALVAYLVEVIKDKRLFDNGLNNEKNAWITVLRDLLKVDGMNDGEGVGLYYFDIDLRELKELLIESELEELLQKYNLEYEEFFTLIQVVFSVFKTGSAINYVKSTLSAEDKLNNLEYRRFDNYVQYRLSKQNKNNSNIKSLMPIKGNSNKVIRYIEKACYCSNDDALELLRIIFETFSQLSEHTSTKYLKQHGAKPAYQMDVGCYVLKNYRNSEYYRCNKCGHLTPHNVNNVCPGDHCEGILEIVDPDEILKNNFYRNEYKNKKIERIVAKEHTAQIEREQAKKYQMEFKQQDTNILFCSTTFEMGIDIGNLETVFMRNVPPTPANYVQRAGRAGRRKESSAFIITYCTAKSHDYTYFCEPEKMISGSIRPPYFDVLNKKIIVRHLMSCCLGYFFRINPLYFESVDEFVFKEGYKEFERFIATHPKELNQYISNKVLPENVYRKYHDFIWFDEMGGHDEKLNFGINELNNLVEEYNLAKEKALEDEDYKEIGNYQQQINYLHKKLKMVEFLSKYSIIPKYGFPIDVVELQVCENGKLLNVDKKGHAGLSRDLKLAISEYAPDSEVIVDGQKYTSKYISLPKINTLQKNYYCNCPQCQKVNVYISWRTMTNCRYCNAELPNSEASYFIEPIYGFKTGPTKESVQRKPKRSYAGEVLYIGGGIQQHDTFTLGGLILVETSSDDELMILNKSSFYLCPTCGYSGIIKGNKISGGEHKNSRGYTCEKQEFEKIHIGHRFKTDVARFVIPSLTSIGEYGYGTALSFLYAFLEGISNALDIERTDINGILEYNMDLSSYDIILYDDVPGGAGHVKRLVNKEVIKEALRAAKLKVSQQCCDEETSCYNCLRNYYNQTFHRYLSRGLARDVIERLLGEIE